MATLTGRPLEKAGTVCRAAASAVIAGIDRRRSLAEVNARIAARPLREQAAIVGAVMAALMVLSFLAAQVGWIGLLLFWLVLIVIVN